MATYVKSTCPNCKYVLEGYTAKYITIGSPLKKCPSCGITIRLTNCNEWELMKLQERLKYYISSAYTGITYFFVPIFLSWIFLGEQWMANNIPLLVVIFIAIEIYSFNELNKMIASSNERMKNEQYRESLKGY
jgi:hypothetical protein